MRPLFLTRVFFGTDSTGATHDKTARRRAALFHEPLWQRVQRVAYGLAYLLMPKRIRQLPALTWQVASGMLRGGVVQPGEAGIRRTPPGFAGVARDITTQSLLTAHRDGFFPQAHMGPLKWWTREQRYVQILAERRIPKTLRNEMRKSRLIITFDQAFDTVIKACAEPRPGRPKLTWITPSIMHHYAKLADAGHAHSFEVWDDAGELVGGGYGVAIGRIFVTESLFSRSSSASKMGMQSLNYHLGLWGFIVNDVKDEAPHFASIGSRYLSRADYQAVLGEYGDAALPANPRIVPWRQSATLADIVNLTAAPDQAAKSSSASPPQPSSQSSPMPVAKPKVAKVARPPRPEPDGAPGNA
jgi:leucyl/phenylalanyl-tRNA---protein transferase